MSLVDLGKRLLEASKHGLTEEVRVLMSNGAPFTTDWLGTSPLHFAAQHGHVGTAEVLLRAGISRDARTKVDRTPLHFAAQAGHRDIVDLLVRNGADIDAKDMLKMTPLHWAVEKANLDVIQYLLQHGSETNSQNKFEKTALDVALTNGRSDIAQLLQHEMEINGTVQEQVIEEFGEVPDHETIAAAQSVATSIEANTIHHTVTSSDDHVAATSQGSTAVLATLAALAEATANSEGSPQHQAAAAASDEATLKWLESQGITMISADNSTIVGNTVQQGNTLALTEAGKLALGQIAKNKRIQDEDGNVLTIVQGQGAGDDSSLGQQVVVTLNPSDIGTEITTEELEEYGEQYTLQGHQAFSDVDDDDGGPSLKRIKMEPVVEEGDVVQGELQEQYVDVPHINEHGEMVNIKLEAADIMAQTEETV